MVQKWEYENYMLINAFSNVKANLNLMGSQGWELCHTIQHFFIFTMYIFKRPIIQQ